MLMKKADFAGRRCCGLIVDVLACFKVFGLDAMMTQ
jgi:hypothetical protein